MKNKTTSASVNQNLNPLIPDNPVLSGYYSSISQFINQIYNEDPSSVDKELVDIIKDADKVSKHDTNSPSVSTLESNWRALSNRIQSDIEQINQKAQSTKISQCINSIKEIISYTNEASPIAQAAKKEQHNIYLLIKKSLTHIEQSISINDNDRVVLQLRGFKSDLSKNYTKFFQLSQLDRAASISAVQDCKKNVDQILRILAGENQFVLPPAEYQSLTRFINQLKLKYDTKKVTNTTQRSKTPPNRREKPQRTNSLHYSPPSSPVSKVAKKTVPQKNTTDVSPFRKTSPISGISKQVRSKTPPTKSSQTTVNRNSKSSQKPSRTKSSQTNTNLSSSMPAEKRRKVTPNRQPNPTNAKDSSSTLKKKSEPINERPPTDTQLKKLQPITFSGGKKASPNLARKANQHIQNLSATQNPTRKSGEVGNLISTAVNIDRSAEVGFADKLGSSSKFNKSSSSLSQDSETDQLVMAVKKAEEQVRQLSPTLEKLQRDLSGGLFNMESAPDTLSPIASFQSSSDLMSDQIVPQKDYNETEKFDSSQRSGLTKQSSSAVNDLYISFNEELKQFDAMVSIGESIKKFGAQVMAGQNEFLVESALSTIDGAIASLYCPTATATADGRNEAALRIGHALSRLNTKISDALSGSAAATDSLVADYDGVKELIQLTCSSSSKPHEANSFMKKIDALNASFQKSRQTMVALSKTKRKRTKSKGDENELLNANRALKVEFERLEAELGNFDKKPLKEGEISCDDILRDSRIVDNLDRMSCEELLHVKSVLSEQMAEMKSQHEEKMAMMWESKEESLRKRIALKSELNEVASQIYDVHHLLLNCGKNKSVEFQSKTVQKEDLQANLLKLISKENQIIQNLIGSV